MSGAQQHSLCGRRSARGSGEVQPCGRGLAHRRLVSMACELSAHTISHAVRAAGRGQAWRAPISEGAQSPYAGALLLPRALWVSETTVYASFHIGAGEAPTLSALGDSARPWSVSIGPSDPALPCGAGPVIGSGHFCGSIKRFKGSPPHVLQIPLVLSSGPHCPSFYLLLEVHAQASQHQLPAPSSFWSRNETSLISPLHFPTHCRTPTRPPKRPPTRQVLRDVPVLLPQGACPVTSQSGNSYLAPCSL